MKKLTLLVLFSLLMAAPSYATHLMGGEITVSDLGNNEYEVTLTAYRDTMGVAMLQQAVINFDGPAGANFSITVPYDTVISGNLLPMYPYGVELYLFRDTVTLSTYGQWDISWSNCCRNGAILNLANPLGESMFLTSSLVIDSTSTNSSPFFLVPAAIFLPVNTAWQYNPLPFDPDGDSLVWSIDTPLTAANTVCAGYLAPASAPANPFSIDPLTGTISWTANAVGNYVASILVDQYRNGVWVGEIRRDMQFIVVQASQGNPLWNNLNNIPVDNNNNYAYNLNQGQNFYMTMVGSHTDPGRLVNIGAFSEIFYLDITNAEFTETHHNLSTLGELEWTPQPEDVRNKPYQVVFRISDGYFTDDKTVLLNVRNPVGNSDIEASLKGLAFPNPLQDVVNVQIEHIQNESATLEVFNLKGQRITEQRTINLKSGQNLFVIDAQEWSPGMYLLNIQGEKGYSFKQMLVVE